MNTTSTMTSSCRYLPNCTILPPCSSRVCSQAATISSRISPTLMSSLTKASKASPGSLDDRQDSLAAVDPGRHSCHRRVQGWLWRKAHWRSPCSFRPEPRELPVQLRAAARLHARSAIQHIHQIVLWPRNERGEIENGLEGLIVDAPVH